MHPEYNGVLSLPVLKWEDNFNYDIYNIQISENKDFSSLSINETTVLKRYRLETAVDENKEYYWRVRGKKLFGSEEYSEWVIISKFTVDITSVKKFDYNIKNLSYYELPYTGYDLVDIENYITDDNCIVLFLYDGSYYYLS